MMMFSMDDMVPQNHMLRLIDKAINWNFIYDLVEEKYCPDNGRHLKKLAKILEKRGWNTVRFLLISKKIKRKEVLKEKWCWV